MVKNRRKPQVFRLELLFIGPKRSEKHIMDTLENIDNTKRFSGKREDTKALFDDDRETTFHRLLDALSVKASSWFGNQGQRPQLDETALCCLGMVVEEFMHYQLTPLIDIDHKNRNIPLLKEQLTREELESGTLPFLVKKYKKKHKVIEEGQAKPRPKLSDDLAAFYKQEFKLENKRSSMMISENKEKKKKTMVEEEHDIDEQIQEEPIRISQKPSRTDLLQDDTQDIPRAIKLQEMQPHNPSPRKHKPSKRRAQSTDFFDSASKGKTSKKKAAKKMKANKQSIF